MTRVLPYLWYPLVLAAAVAGFHLMLANDAPLLAAMYLPITLAGLVIVALELREPERLDWRPSLADVKNDALFMVLVQIVLPRLLGVLLVLAVAEKAHAGFPSSWWPHGWPLAAQAVTMVLTVDFLRYWLHRACHTWTPLWRLHEVHHSPDILYTLNVGRFHPLEKVLHFLLDSVPFVLLGVAPEVLAAYFLLYSVNGFFQHSNVRLRYGVLNYLVGSAETHRWHHARDPRTACCNFGNTTLVWDLLFGTWYLPRDRDLDIGIPDRAYPRDFLSQMLTPFRPTHGPRRSLRGRVANIAIDIMLRVTRARVWLSISRAVRDPMRPQYALLARLLHDNRDTRFGREHGFEHLRDYQQFAEAVPVCDYEALRPYVRAEIESGEAALTAEAPVSYLRTSGTTGEPKDLPLTASHLRLLRRIQRVSVAQQHRLYPEAFHGSILAITSPAVEGLQSNGKPYGSASGVVAAATPRIIRDKFVLPREVLEIQDSRVRYLMILRLALARPDITYVGSANASTLLTLAQLCREHAEALTADLARGGFFLSAQVPEHLMTALAGRLAPVPERAREVAALLARDTPTGVADLWPQLRLAVVWTCASAGVAAAALRNELPPRTTIRELGYVSSEFRGTLTLGRRAGSGLPTFDSHFFEFVARDRWDRDEPEFLTLDQLRKGAEYYVIVTTPSGLYRYFINDLVRVSGFLHRMPLLVFLQKGKGVTSITGEKLYESQVLAAVHHALARFDCAARFVMMLADEQTSSYRLYVEIDGHTRKPAKQLAEFVDERLQTLNIEYHSKRESSRLAPLTAAWLVTGSEQRYKDFCVARGQREGQFKVLALAYRSGFEFDIEACVRSD